MSPSKTASEMISSSKINAIKRLALSDTGFVFDPESGRSFTANSTGLLLIRLIQKHTEVNKIISIVQKEYGVDKSELESNIVDFVKALDLTLE